MKVYKVWYKYAPEIMEQITLDELFGLHINKWELDRFKLHAERHGIIEYRIEIGNV